MSDLARYVQGEVVNVNGGSVLVGWARRDANRGAERLDRRDARFVIVCLAVIAAGSLVTALLFRRAFPEASIEFRVSRGDARRLAEKFLAGRAARSRGPASPGASTSRRRPKVYLERELGLERAGRLYGREARVWRWQMRWFRSGVKEEERVAITPLGDLVAFESVQRDEAPGPRPPQAQARAIAEAFLASRGLPAGSRTPIEASPSSRPKRTDWRFVDEWAGSSMAGATKRFETLVSQGRVLAYRGVRARSGELAARLPEAPLEERGGERRRDVRPLRHGHRHARGAHREDRPPGRPLEARRRLRSVGFLLSLLSTFNEIPLTLYDYDTASSLASHMTNQILVGILRAIAIGAGIAVVVAAAEPVYRERFPRQLSLAGLFSRRGIATKRFFRGVLLGYALTAFFFAYQAVFYVVAERFGAWAPADIPYSDMLNTALPWATVLLIGFLPAV